MSTETGPAKFVICTGAGIKCISCGTTEKPTMDWGAWFEYFGACGLCVDCLKEMSVPLGLISAEQHQNLKNKAEDVAHYLGKLSDFFNRTADDASSLHLDFRAVVNPGGIVVPPVPDLEPEESGDSEGGESESPTGEQEVDEFTLK